MSDSPFQLSERIGQLEDKIDILLILVEGKAQREFLTVRETADLLRCSTSAIRDRLRYGVLNFQRLGNSETSPILIRRMDITEMMK